MRDVAKVQTHATLGLAKRLNMDLLRCTLRRRTLQNKSSLQTMRRMAQHLVLKDRCG